MSTRPISSLEKPNSPPPAPIPTAREEQDARVQAAVQRRPEVEEAFSAYLAKAFTGLESPIVTGYAQACVEALNSYDLNKFFLQLKTLFANIPYDMHIDKEKYYQLIFFAMALLIGLDPDLEVKPNRGRIDMTIKTKNHIYIFEFKIDSTGQAALDQIKDRKYFEKYACDGRAVVLVGANFNTADKNLTDDWKVERLPSMNLSH